MTKFLTIALTLFTLSIAYSQPQVEYISPLPNNSLDRNSPVTIHFKVKGAVFYNGLFGGIDYAESITPTIFLYQDVSKIAITNTTCSISGCTFTFTPTTNLDTLGIYIEGTADMDYGQANTTTFIVSDINFNVVGPLSVEMLSFEATSPKAGIVQLNWVTASEKNNAHFDVERSYDGVKFEKIGQVAGVGTSELENNYSFTDSQKAEGRLAYYRLTIVDTNGESRYSKVVVAYDKKGKLNIQSANEQVVNFEAASNGNIEMNIYNVNGQAILNQNIRVTEGYNSINLNTNALASGLYILHLNDGRERKTIKFFKH